MLFKANVILLKGVSVVGTWTAGGQLSLDWANVFRSDDSLLIYELTVGSHAGTADVLQWFETVGTQHVIGDNRVSRFVDYHVTLTAINAAGLHTTVTSTIRAQP